MDIPFIHVCFIVLRQIYPCKNQAQAAHFFIISNVTEMDLESEVGFGGYSQSLLVFTKWATVCLLLSYLIPTTNGLIDSV